MTEKIDGRIICNNYGVDCLNTAVAEVDMGNGVKWYCRSCIENYGYDPGDSDTYIIDESLVFCNTEWNKQG